MRKLRVLRLEGGAVARGEAHGEAFAAAIRAYAEERVHLAAAGAWSGRPVPVEEVLGLARRMLPAHEAYDPGLYAEMCAMARAAGISAEEAVIVGGFTDFVDAARATSGGSGGVEEDDCTSVLAPPVRTGGLGELFAQTWDMHDSATEHVVLFDLRPEEGPPALVFSTVGCLGQIGVNAAGITVGINNLVCTDGRVGVTWNFPVRQALGQSTLAGAEASVAGAKLAGGHAYLLADAEGGLILEHSARLGVRFESSRANAFPVLVHTNHCVAPETRVHEAKRDAGLLASSRDRLRTAEEALATGNIDVDRLKSLMAEPTCICRHGGPPSHIETSGAIVVRPATRELWATWGPPDTHPWERFRVGDG